MGRLLNWSKGFNCPGVVGKDVVKLLQDAICRRRVRRPIVFVYTVRCFSMLYYVSRIDPAGNILLFCFLALIH